MASKTNKGTTLSEEAKTWLSIRKTQYKKKMDDRILREMVAGDVRVFSLPVAQGWGSVDLVRSSVNGVSSFRLRFPKRLVQESPDMVAKHGLPLVWNADAADFHIDGREMITLWRMALSDEYQQERQKKNLLQKQFAMIANSRSGYSADGGEMPPEYAKLINSISERWEEENRFDLTTEAGSRDDVVFAFQTTIQRFSDATFVSNDSDDMGLVKYMTSRYIWSSFEDDTWRIARINGTTMSGEAIEYCVCGNIETFRNDAVLHRVTN